MRDDEIEASIISQYREEMDERDRLEIEDRVRRTFEADKIVALGKECRQFLDSRVGRYVLDCAIKQQEAATKELIGLKMDSFSSKDNYIDKIKELQFEADVPARIFTFLNNAIHAAHEELNSLEEN